MLKRILVGLGGTDYATTAINQAIALAVAHKAEVTGVSVLDEARLASVGPVPLGGGHYAHELAEHRLTKAQELVEWSSRRPAARRVSGTRCCAKWANHSP
jgi:nucleotide-binding universal stress UspA family protein